MSGSSAAFRPTADEVSATVSQRHDNIINIIREQRPARGQLANQVGETRAACACVVARFERRPPLPAAPRSPSWQSRSLRAAPVPGEVAVRDRGQLHGTLIRRAGDRTPPPLLTTDALGRNSPARADRRARQLATGYLQQARSGEISRHGRRPPRPQRRAGARMACVAYRTTLSGRRGPRRPG